MPPISQKQHKIPQVYLKKFGYQNAFGQWKRSVKKRGSKNVDQETIKKFSTSNNHFNLKSPNLQIQRAFEDGFNQAVETSYNRVIDQLEKQQRITADLKEYFSQIIPNFIVRSDSVRMQVSDLIKSTDKENALKAIIYSTKLNPSVEQEVDFDDMIEGYLAMDEDSLMNRLLILLSNFIFLHLWSFEYVILTPPDSRQWWTSDNPVVAYDKTENRFFVTKQTEVFMPLTSTTLLYLHHPNSIDKKSPLRKLQADSFNQVDNETHDRIMRHILTNAYEQIILAGNYTDEDFA